MTQSKRLTSGQLEEMRKRSDKANSKNWLTDFDALANAVNAVADNKVLIAEVERLRKVTNQTVPRRFEGLGFLVFLIGLGTFGLGYCVGFLVFGL